MSASDPSLALWSSNELGPDKQEILILILILAYLQLTAHEHDVGLRAVNNQTAPHG
jgi:hypothetical protein